jgi:hypothetical protein
VKLNIQNTPTELTQKLELTIVKVCSEELEIKRNATSAK